MRVRPSKVNRSPNRARHDASGPGAWTRTRLQVRVAGTETDCVVIVPAWRHGPAGAATAVDAPGTDATGTMTRGAGAWAVARGPGVAAMVVGPVAGGRNRSLAWA